MRVELQRYQTAVLRPDWFYLAAPSAGTPAVAHADQPAGSGAAPSTGWEQGRVPSGLIGFDGTELLPQ
eukprot:7680164-Alexandrium_andersonii.AAC.1